MAIMKKMIIASLLAFAMLASQGYTQEVFKQDNTVQVDPSIDVEDKVLEHSNVKFTIVNGFDFSIVEVKELMEFEGRKFVSLDTIKTFELREAGSYVFTGPTGDYLIVVISFNEEDRTTSRFEKQVSIVKTLTDDPVDPVDPVDPNPDDFNVTELRELSGDLAKSLGDETTAFELQAAYKGLSESILTETSIIDAQVKVSSVFERIMLMRIGDSRNVEWADNWRRPLATKIGELIQGKESVENYAKVLGAIADGLQDAIDSS